MQDAKSTNPGNNTENSHDLRAGSTSVVFGRVRSSAKADGQEQHTDAGQPRIPGVPQAELQRQWQGDFRLGTQ
jgi:hypothetical protein